MQNKKTLLSFTFPRYVAIVIACILIGYLSHALVGSLLCAFILAGEVFNYEDIQSLKPKELGLNDAGSPAWPGLTTKQIRYLGSWGLPIPPLLPPVSGKKAYAQNEIPTDDKPLSNRCLQDDHWLSMANTDTFSSNDDGVFMNPATGLFMYHGHGGLDTNGNPYGIDLSRHDTTRWDS